MRTDLRSIRFDEAMSIVTLKPPLRTGNSTVRSIALVSILMVCDAPGDPMVVSDGNDTAVRLGQVSTKMLVPTLFSLSNVSADPAIDTMLICPATDSRPDTSRLVKRGQLCESKLAPTVLRLGIDAETRTALSVILTNPPTDASFAKDAVTRDPSDSSRKSSQARRDLVQ